MKEFYRKNQEIISVAVVSFAVGFAVAFFVTKYYDNLVAVGNYCADTVKQAGKFLGIF